MERYLVQMEQVINMENDAGMEDGRWGGEGSEGEILAGRHMSDSNPTLPYLGNHKQNNLTWLHLNSFQLYSQQTDIQAKFSSARKLSASTQTAVALINITQPYPIGQHI